MTDPTKAIKDALEAGPTEGPWEVGGIYGHEFVRITARDGALTIGTVRDSERTGLDSHGFNVFKQTAEGRANAALIAACNPTAIRSLLSRLEDAERGNDRYETVRRLNPQAFLDAYILNQRTGKSFDEIIDNLKPFVRPAAMKEQSK